MLIKALAYKNIKKTKEIFHEKRTLKKLGDKPVSSWG